MSVVLYKMGEQRDIKGLKCDILNVAPELFDVETLPKGWFLTPEAAHEETKEETKAEETEKAKVLTGNAKIRSDAKEAGIEEWETARIATLKEKLKA